MEPSTALCFLLQRPRHESAGLSCNLTIRRARNWSSSFQEKAVIVSEESCSAIDSLVHRAGYLGSESAKASEFNSLTQISQLIENEINKMVSRSSRYGDLQNRETKNIDQLVV